jgi:hypothetical protein
MLALATKIKLWLLTKKGQVQTQPHAIWQKRLVLEKMFPTSPCDPSIDAKSPSGFRSWQSAYWRGC